MDYEKAWELAKARAAKRAKASYPDQDARQEYFVLKFTLEEYASLTTPPKSICKLCGR